MIMAIVWLAAALFVFLSNHFGWRGFLGIRFLEDQRISAGWLCLVLGAYCLVRTWVRKRRRRSEEPR